MSQLDATQSKKLNYMDAVLKENPKRSIEQFQIEKNNIDEAEMERRNSYYAWLKTTDALSKNWEKYKQNYIEIHGEDEYEKMYSIPNYWVMPEDEEENYEESDSENRSVYSYDEDDNYDNYSDYDRKW